MSIKKEILIKKEMDKGMEIIIIKMAIIIIRELEIKTIIKTIITYNLLFIIILYITFISYY